MTTVDARPTTSPPTRDRLSPIQHDGRPVGAYVLQTEGVTYLPVVDVTRLATIGAVAIVLTAAVTAAVRRPPAIGAVTMGPGGWISLKRTAAPPLRDDRRRPWWAHVLRAQRLVVRR